METTNRKSAETKGREGQATGELKTGSTYQELHVITGYDYIRSMGYHGC